MTLLEPAEGNVKLLLGFDHQQSIKNQELLLQNLMNLTVLKPFGDAQFCTIQNQQKELEEIKHLNLMLDK